MREWLAGSGPPREMPRRYTYAPAPSAPWSNGVGRAISVGLGSDLLGNTARALLLSCRQASTYNTYRSVLNSWAQFLASEGVEDIMLATTTTVLRYVAWLGLRGTVAAGSMQVYLSGINAVQTDFGLHAIAQGKAVQDAVRGLAAAQLTMAPVVPRSPLPPAAITAMLDLAGLLCASMSVHPPVRLLRACLATTVSYLFFNRASSTHSLRMEGLIVDPPSTVGQSLRLRASVRKGQSHLHPQKQEMRIPVAAQGQLAACLLTFQRWRGASSSAHYWWLPGDSTPSKWTALVQTSWLLEALRACKIAVPPLVAWTSHSLRQGAATHAAAAGVPMAVIRHYGGWARASNVVYNYIDPSERNSTTAQRLFGWLTATHLPAAIPMGEPADDGDFSDAEPPPDSPRTALQLLSGGAPPAEGPPLGPLQPERAACSPDAAVPAICEH